jgi:hypothetical protein
VNSIESNPALSQIALAFGAAKSVHVTVVDGHREEKIVDTVEQLGVSYPVSRYRYLRVRVNRDPQVDSDAPQIAALRVRRSVQVQGEMVSFRAEREERDADRLDGRPASVWRIDLGGRVPFERLSFDIATATFSRPFQVEIVDYPAAPVLIASGELTRGAETAGQPLADGSAEGSRGDAAGEVCAVDRERSADSHAPQIGADCVRLQAPAANSGGTAGLSKICNQLITLPLPLQNRLRPQETCPHLPPPTNNPPASLHFSSTDPTYWWWGRDGKRTPGDHSD